MTPRSKDSVGAVALDLVIDGKSYNAQIKNITRSSQKQLKGMEGQFTSSFGKIAKMAAGAFAVVGIGKFVGDCLSLGSALTEVENITAVAFPGMTKQVNDFAKNAAAQFGLSETMAKRFTGMYGTMAKQFGYTNEAAFEMGSTLAGLAGDVASFYDMSQDEAYTKLKAVFSGETEVLKDIGIVMTQAALDQYALANSYGKTTAKMNEQEKVALRYAFVQDQLTAASGDFVRTQDSWANQTRLLSLQFDSLKASLGKGFIALFTPIIKGINWVLSNLQVLADSFANMMEFLTGTSSSSGGSGALAETSGDIASAADSADGLSSGLGTAGKEGEKAAKKINKAFAKVDTINKLTFDSGDSDSDSGSGGSGATGGSVADTTEFPKATEQATVFSKMMDGIINEFKRLSAIFVKGFEIGFGDSINNIQRIKEYMSSIGDSIVNIFSDSNVVNSFGRMIDSWVFSLGTLTGSLASIGTTIATLFVGSIATYLERNTGFIKDRLVSIFDIKTENNVIMSGFYSTIADIASVFASPTAVSIGANFIQIIANSMMGAIELILRIGTDIIDAIVTPIRENGEKIKTAISNTLAPIEVVTKTIANGVNDTFKKISETYDAYIGPAFTKIKEGLSTMLGAILDNYNKYIAPVLNVLAEKFSVLWVEYIQPAINSIIEFFGKIAELIGVVWENVLAPMVAWMSEIFAPIIGAALMAVWSIFETVVQFISNAIQAVVDTFKGIIDFLIGVFTGDWELAWQGINDFFSGIADQIFAIVEFVFGGIFDFIGGILGGISDVWTDIWGSISSFFSDIWDGICSGVEGAINTVSTIISDVVNGIKNTWQDAWAGIKSFVSDTWNAICNLFSSGGQFFDGVVGAIGDIFTSIINTVIRGINKIISIPLGVISDALKTIHDIDLPLIGKPFTIVPRGFNIPKIPELAQGGYVKANQPQLAMIGDNRHQGEVVAPEGKMVEMINTALKMQKDNGSVNGIDEVIKLLKLLIETINGLCLKVDIDMKKLSILLEKAKRERDMIGG